ncbi:MAG: FAD-binding protein, partial [Carnobacterium sp.]
EVLTKEGTSIKGLYAAGELTGGLHGENRIGGNSVAEIIIFGRQAGIKSAEFVHSLK